MGTTLMQKVIIRGLIAGYVYAIILSASAISVCEIRSRSDCTQVWSQGYSTATGLVTTFLAYFIQPSKTSKKEEDDASA